jgi:photosystem II stability/assembly factor-like uncharacterized protein
MVSKTQKILTVIMLIALSACSPKQSTPNFDRSTFPAPWSSTYPPITSTPAPTQSITAVPSIDPLPQKTPEPSPSPPPLPLLTEQTPPNMRISQLTMFDANIGWAMYSAPFNQPENRKVLRTTDGMQTWIDFTSPISETNTTVRSAFFINEDEAVIVSSRSLLPGSPEVEAIPWRTTNGGQTWQAGEALPKDNASLFYPAQLIFLDQEQGWLLGDSDAGMKNLRVHLFESRDGGSHWGMVYDTANHLDDPNTLWISGYFPFLERFTFISETVGFFSDGRLFSTQDGGRSWEFRPLEPPTDLPEVDCTGSDCPTLDTVSAPRFTSAQDGILIRRVYLNSDVVRDVFLYYPNAVNRLPLPTAQYLYYTHDGGQTWVPRPSPVNIGTAYFQNASTGWLLGKSEPDPAIPTQLYQTTDGGETWTQIAADCPLPLGSELQFVDERTGFAFFPFALADVYQDFDNRIRESESNSTLFTTQDGGHSWEEVVLEVIPFHVPGAPR